MLYARKSLKFNINGLALADIPLASHYGLSYELLLDRNYGIQVGIGYLGYPVSSWGSDSVSQAWRNTVSQFGYSLDASFRHYFNDADETTYYISTYFSTSRLWLNSTMGPADLLLKKDRIALMIGRQKTWRTHIYFDFSMGVGVKFKNWRTHIQQVKTVANRLTAETQWAAGWNMEFNVPTTSIAFPVQFLVGFRF